MQVPALFHAVDMQSHVNAGSLYVESVPAHTVQTVALLHFVQLVLQAIMQQKQKIYLKIILDNNIFIIFISKIK